MFLVIANIIGVIAFSISGMLKGLKHKLDIFGVIVLGVMTAVGGGIVRDVLLNQMPASILDESDVYLAIVTAIIAWLFFHNKLIGNSKMVRFVMISDALGLAAFAVIGASKGVEAGLGPFSTAIMATLTGVGGGVIRDMMVTEIPFILKEDVYAALCLLGGLIYWILATNKILTGSVLGYSLLTVIFIVRLLAIRFKMNLPKKTVEN